MNFKNPEGQTARWIEILGIYDLEVEHRQGRIHGNANGLSRRPCTNCSHCERGERKGQCADQLNEEELVGHEDGEDDDEYRCATATKKEEGSGMNSWLPKLSNTEMREAQLQDKCLGAIIKLKEENAERPSWEMISMGSPTFKSYWAQWSMLAVRDGVLFPKWESERGDEITWKLVPPDSLKKEVLRQLNDNPAAGHLGFKKTTERVTQGSTGVVCVKT